MFPVEPKPSSSQGRPLLHPRIDSNLPVLEVTSMTFYFKEIHLMIGIIACTLYVFILWMLSCWTFTLSIVDILIFGLLCHSQYSQNLEDQDVHITHPIPYQQKQLVESYGFKCIHE